MGSVASSCDLQEQIHESIADLSQASNPKDAVPHDDVCMTSEQVYLFPWRGCPARRMRRYLREGTRRTPPPVEWPRNNGIHPWSQLACHCLRDCRGVNAHDGDKHQLIGAVLREYSQTFHGSKTQWRSSSWWRIYGVYMYYSLRGYILFCERHL